MPMPVIHVIMWQASRTARSRLRTMRIAWRPTASRRLLKRRIGQLNMTRTRFFFFERASVLLLVCFPPERQQPGRFENDVRLQNQGCSSILRSTVKLSDLKKYTSNYLWILSSKWFNSSPPQSYSSCFVCEQNMTRWWTDNNDDTRSNETCRVQQYIDMIRVCVHFMSSVVQYTKSSSPHSRLPSFDAICLGVILYVLDGKIFD